MGRKRHEPTTRGLVEKMRKSGKTYAEIRSRFPIPKSTLSNWLGKKYPGIYTRKIQLEHLRKIRVRAQETIKRTKAEREAHAIEAARNIVGMLPISDVSVRTALLAMLYWAEGTKAEGSHGLRFVNTDPHLTVLFITLLRVCFPIDEKRLRIRLHLHHYHSIREATEYWSSILRVPAGQFWKPYRKQRNAQKRHRKNFMGICFIYYPGHYMRKELLEVGYMIHGILSDHTSRSLMDRMAACGVADPGPIPGGRTREKRGLREIPQNI